MKRIGLISDTHGWLDERIFHHMNDCDEVWHAGDIGTAEVLKQLQAFKPVRAVWGNIDGSDIRALCPEHQHFECEGVKVWITHIAGKPDRYAQGIEAGLHIHRPGLLVCGHSHICQVMPDKKNALLFMNPGAAGMQGFHPVRTILRFEIAEGQLHNLQVVELGKRG